MKESIFSIYDANEYENLKFIATKNENYFKTAPDDDDGVIIPVLLPGKFENLVLNQKLKFQINVANYYNFAGFPNIAS